VTRLDSAIRRLTAQRDLLDWAVQRIPQTGIIVELGLGNGRTFDHLRDRLPDRDVYAFERHLAAHPGSLPDKGKLILGDIFETMPGFTKRMGQAIAALVHADIGSGDEDRNREVARRMAPLVEPLLLPGGLLLADRPFNMPGCEDISRDTGVSDGRYYVYRRLGA
jgi:hypothetical protein